MRGRAEQKIILHVEMDMGEWEMVRESLADANEHGKRPQSLTNLAEAMDMAREDADSIQNPDLGIGRPPS